jgi:hypothetical protein
MNTQRLTLPQLTAEIAVERFAEQISFSRVWSGVHRRTYND